MHTGNLKQFGISLLQSAKAGTGESIMVREGCEEYTKEDIFCPTKKFKFQFFEVIGDH